jgi:aspartate aminotransferase
MQLARRLERLKAPASLTINAAALALKEQGIAVTSLAVGEPDFDPPDHVRAAAKKAIDDGCFRYTAVPGIMALRQAVAGYFRRCYGVAADPEQILAANGGKQILYNLFLALLDPGDEVIIPTPCWLSYPDMVKLAGGVPVGAFADSGQGYKVRPDQLEAVRTDKTRVLVFNSPSNPTGAVYSEQESEAILHWAMEHDIFLVADEIYDRLVYAPARVNSLSPWWSRHPDKLAIVNGLSKSFAMTGWRVGYALADAALIRAMAKLQGQTTSNICAVAQHAAIAALTGPYDAVENMRLAFARRRDAAWSEISSWPGVVCPKPDGAFYLLVDVNALCTRDATDVAALGEKLLRQAHVAVVPGDDFGAPGCLRLSYAIDDAQLLDALRRIRGVLFGA